MNNSKKLGIVAYSTILLALAVLIFAFFSSADDNNSINSEKLSDFNQKWKIEVNGKDMGIHNLPAKVEAKKGDIVRITNTLPQQLSQNATLFFRSSQSFVKVLTQGKELYSFGYNSQRLFGHSPGSAWQIVRIPVADFGKTLSIEFMCPYEKYSGSINQVQIGTKAAIIFDILRQGSWSFVAGILMLLIGFVLIGVYLAMHSRFKYHGLFHLGVFSVLFSIWSIGESKLLQLVFGYLEIADLLVFTSFFLLPIPFLLFLNTLDVLKNDKHIKMMAYFHTANFFVLIALQLFSIMDMFSLVSIFTVELLLTLLIIAYKFARGLKRDTFKEYLLLISSLGVVLLFAGLSVIRFMISAKTDNSSFMSMGFFLFVLLLGCWSLLKTLKSYSLQVEKNTFASMAYTDILTRLPNRAFFEKTISEYEKRKQSGVIIMFDLNDLKIINEKFSFGAGDAALVACANIIKESFTQIGLCCRIGGDEFAVIGDIDKAQHIDICAQAMKAAIAKACTMRECPIDMSFGFACFSPDTNTPHDALHDADAQMYVNKTQKKSQDLLAT